MKQHLDPYLLQEYLDRRSSNAFPGIVGLSTHSLLRRHRWSSYVLLILMAAIATSIAFYLFKGGPTPKKLDFHRFKELASQHQVSGVELKGRHLQYHLTDGTPAVSEISPTDAGELWQVLVRNDLSVSLPGQPQPRFWTILITVVAFSLLAMLARSAWRTISPQPAYGRFGKSRAKLLNTSGKKITLSSLVFDEEMLKPIALIIDFLKEPQKYQRLGGRIPKGFLLVGAPGTGKTALGRAIGGQANVPLFYLSGSDFDELSLGAGAARVRDLFDQGKKNAPCIVFIDELDSVARPRSKWPEPNRLEREITTSQLLVEIDGFEASEEGLIIIAATNRPDLIDPAFLRPGRLTSIAIPDLQGAPSIKFVELLKRGLKNIPTVEDIDLESYADTVKNKFPDATPALVLELVNRAALLAGESGDKNVSKKHLHLALSQFSETNNLLRLAIEKADTDVR